MEDAKAQEEPDTAENEDAAAPPSLKSNAGEARFNDDIVILTGERLKEYDKGEVKAYRARGSGTVPSHLFALICEDDLVPRSATGAKHAAILNPGLVRLMASGIIHWPEAKKEKYVFIFEDTLGRRLMKDATHGGLGWPQDMVMASVIKPMISVLLDLRDKDVIHGEIYPGNMFDGGSANVERVVLGEGLSTPVSSRLPALYEPVERAMAAPEARGLGTHEDDLYAFGVSLAVILRAHDPLEGMSEEKIIEQKMEIGSYQALTGKDRFTGAVLELLRGLLYDDRDQRWTLDEVQAWMDGRRLSPKQAPKKIKGSRPVIFDGKKYLRPTRLSKDLLKNVIEATKLVDSGEMEQWLQRAVEDKLLQRRYEKALEIAGGAGRGTGYAERLTTIVSMALDPDAPIRYDKLVFMPDGFGKSLIRTYINKQELQPYVDVINNSFVLNWIDMQVNTAVDIGAIISRFDTCRAFIRQTNIGFGLERCLYYLVPESPCLSEKLKDYYVRTPEDMMQAFEKIATSPKRPLMFFDRHIISFLSVKDRKNIDPYMGEIGAEELYKRVLGELKTLATIQKRSRLEKFPGITTWVADNLEPVYERLHDRDIRIKIKERVEKAKAGGDLSKIAGIFDNMKLYEKDSLEFRRAMRDYYDLDNEKDLIERKMQNQKTYGQDAGHQIAAVISAILAGIVIIASAIYALT